MTAESDDENLSAAYRQLVRIADVLDVPVSDFLDGEKGPLALEGAVELQHIWDVLQSDHRRERLLAFARDLARSS